MAEITRIARGAEFDGIRPLDGTADRIGLHVTPGGDPALDVELDLDEAADAGQLGLGSTTLAGADNTAALEAVVAVESATAAVSRKRASLGAIQNRLESTIRNIQNQGEHLSAARSRIVDVDVAEEVSLLTRNRILQEVGVSLLAQVNEMPDYALFLLLGSTV